MNGKSALYPWPCEAGGGELNGLGCLIARAFVQGV
jgi:hypothetical protein